MVLPSKSVALPLTVEPSTWKSPLDRITPMDGGTAVKKSRQPLLRSEINARVAQFTVSIPPNRLLGYITPGMTRKQYDLSRTSTKYIVPRELEYRCNTQKKSNNQKTIPPSCLKWTPGCWFGTGWILGCRTRKQCDHHYGPGSQGGARERIVHSGVQGDCEHPGTPSPTQRRAQTPQKQGRHRKPERQPAIGRPSQPVIVSAVYEFTCIDDCVRWIDYGPSPQAESKPRAGGNHAH